jgi:hypothetical protein
MASTAKMADVPAASPRAIALKTPPPSPTKSKLLPTPSVADVLAHDGSVDVRMLMISMWKHRANAPFTAELCQRLCSMPITQPMLDQVEFYLPQLAHMVVHLERELPMEDMEQFVLLLSQSSVHFALQQSPHVRTLCQTAARARAVLRVRLAGSSTGVRAANSPEYLQGRDGPDPHG